MIFVMFATIYFGHVWYDNHLKLIEYISSCENEMVTVEDILVIVDAHSKRQTAQWLIVFNIIIILVPLLIK